MSEPRTILMTCGDGPGVVGHIHALRNNMHAPVRVVVGDVSADENIGFALADASVQLPPSSDSALIDKLLDVCSRLSVDVLWPVFDGELEPLAAARERCTSKGVDVLGCDVKTVELCLDKGRFLQRLGKTGLVPPAEIVRSAAELEAAAETFGYPDRPVAVKPTRGTGGRGFHVIDAGYEPARGFFDERPDSMRCDLATAAAALEARPATTGADVLVMPYVSGREFGCDVLADGGDVLACVTRRKLPPIRERMHTRIVVAEEPGPIGVVAALVGAIGATGLLSVDLREDEDGQRKVLEVNPRAGAYLGMSCARIDLMGMALAHLAGERPTATSYRRTSEEIVAIRHWSDRVQKRGTGYFSPLLPETQDKGRTEKK